MINNDEPKFLVGLVSIPPTFNGLHSVACLEALSALFRKFICICDQFHYMYLVIMFFFFVFFFNFCSFAQVTVQPMKITDHLMHVKIQLMDRIKRIWYLSPMRAAKVQASLRIRAVSPEPSLLAHTSSESRGTLRQKARSLAQLNGWACAVEICHDGMLEDTNSLDGAHLRLHY